MRQRRVGLTDTVVVNTGMIANNQGVKVLSKQNEAVWWTCDTVSWTTTTGSISSWKRSRESSITIDCISNWEVRSSLKAILGVLNDNLSSHLMDWGEGIVLGVGVGEVCGVLTNDDGNISRALEVFDGGVDEMAGRNENVGELFALKQHDILVTSEESMNVRAMRNVADLYRGTYL